MHESAAEALKQYPLSNPKLQPLAGGLINTSFRVDATEGSYVLQALHPIFRAELHHDIEAVTRHLQRKHLPTPVLVPTRQGTLFTTIDGKVWRVMTYLPSRTYERVTSPSVAAAAGRLVGVFHNAVSDLAHDFHFVRQGVHDTAHHLQVLREAVDSKHRFYDRNMAVADEILSAKLHPLSGDKRIAHGDLKITNLLFDERGDGLCLIDLDTMGKMLLAHEMGDAWRSWCNPLGEDDPDAYFDLSLFEASARAYLSIFNAPEKGTLVQGIATIALELAARFCADAFKESYFGWNPNKFPDRSTHNWVRARSQLQLYKSVMQQAAKAEQIVESV